MRCCNLKRKVHIIQYYLTLHMWTVLSTDSWDTGREVLLMVPLGQRAWWQTDRSNRWHTFGCTKSLLCCHRAHFSPSCSKFELILNAFHSEGETRNCSLEELRGGLFRRGVTPVLWVHVCTCTCTFECIHKSCQSYSNRGRSMMILSEVSVYNLVRMGLLNVT